MSTTSTTLISVGVGIFFLFIVFVIIESREDDGEGKKVFSPEKLGLTLKNAFSICLPDRVLLFFAKIFICCGYVGNSCMEHVHADEEVRETKRLARVAASLSKKSGASMKKKKKSRSRQDDTDFERLPDEDEVDIESGGSDDNRSRSSSKSSSRREGSSSSKKTSRSASSSSGTFLVHPGDKSPLPVLSQYLPFCDTKSAPSSSMSISSNIASSFTVTTCPPHPSSSAASDRYIFPSRAMVNESRLDLSRRSDGSGDSEHSGIFINELVPLSMIEAHIAAEDNLVTTFHHSHY